MNKPELKCVDMAINWREAREWIRHKTGRDIRDWLGKFGPDGKEFHKEIPYRDFWNWITDHCDIHNGCLFSLRSEHLENCQGDEAWAAEVLNMFIAEFGDGTKYWTEW